jgi:hypothetical protein
MLLLGYRYWEGRFSLCSFSSAETCGVGRTTGLLLLKRTLLNFQVEQGNFSKTNRPLSQTGTHKTRLSARNGAIGIRDGSSSKTSIGSIEG